MKRFDYVANSYVQGASVQLTYADDTPPIISAPTNEVLGYCFIPDITPGSLVNVLVDYTVDAAAAGSVNHTRQKAYVPAEATYNYNPYVVPWTWLQDVADGCGVTLATPVGNNPSADLRSYATLAGTLKDADGNPVAGVPKTGFKITLGTYDNENPDYVCFLDEDGATGKYVGTAAANSTATGKFVVFKLKNEVNLGTGTAYVSVTAGQALFEDALFLHNTAAVATLYTVEDAPPPPLEPVDFEADILPLFATYGCTACHYEGGPGSVERGGYYADFTGEPQDVCDNLVSAGTQCDGTTKYRVCLNDPYVDDSYLISKPLNDNPPNHPNASFFSADEPDLVMIRTWIQQGVARYATPPVPPQPIYSFEGVFGYLGVDGVNCTSCHGYNTGYAGGLSLDGCIGAFNANGTYADAGIDSDGASNPYYKQDCAFYHVALEPIDVDAYYAPEGYRINKTANYENRSLLLQKAYCGGVYCADNENPLVHGNGARIFYNLDDAIPSFISSWITAGYYNDLEANPGVDHNAN
ncbi:MAG: hypothetical protein GY822_04680 [Deltaproteobacteria bacterium]|nr:hypothetical protein [Deltaproteobacteria bacterium]